MKKVFMSFMICFLMIGFCSSVFAGDLVQGKFTWVLTRRDNGKVVKIPIKQMVVDIDYKRREVRSTLYMPELNNQFPTIFPEMILLIGPYTKGQTRLEWFNSPTIAFTTSYIDVNIP